jgi:hypothetical protein
MFTADKRETFLQAEKKNLSGMIFSPKHNKKKTSGMIFSP